MIYFFTLVFFLIPAAWSTKVNANYLTTKTFLLYCIAGLAAFAISDKINLRAIPKKLFWMLAAVVVYQVGWYIAYYDQTSFWISFKVIAFWLLTLYFYSLNISFHEFLKKCSLLIGALACFIFSVAMNQMWGQLQSAPQLTPALILSTFGNVNMSSEFLILSLPIVYYWSKQKDSINNYFKLSIFSFHVFLLLFFSSRSAWIGLALFFAWIAYKKVAKKEIFFILFSFVLYFCSMYSAGNAGQLSSDKAASAAERSVLYKGTAELILDHPFGTEPAAYLSDVTPYLGKYSEDVSEFTYFDQPHSEPLKWAVQFGVPMMLLGLAILAYLFFTLFKATREPNKDGEINEANQFYFAFFLTLLPQIFFQFPFENPATILIMAFVLGLYLSKFNIVDEFTFKYLKVPLLIVASFTILNGVLFLSAVYLESTSFKSPEVMRVVCNVYPANYKSCFWKHWGYLETKQPQRFAAEFKNDMSRFPLYTDYMRILPSFLEAAGNEKRMCESLMIYGAIYPKQRSFKPEHLEYCKSKYSAPYSLADKAQFKENYLKWLQAL